MEETTTKTKPKNSFLRRLGYDSPDTTTVIMAISLSAGIGAEMAKLGVKPIDVLVGAVLVSSSFLSLGQLIRKD